MVLSKNPAVRFFGWQAYALMRTPILGAGNKVAQPMYAALANAMAKEQDPHVLAEMLKKPLLSEHVMKNVYFDTCVYHQPGINLLFEVIDVDNVLFASEMVGAVRGIDPQTGHYFDDTKRYIDALDLNAEDHQKVFELNARRVYPRLDAHLKAQGR